MKRFVVKSFSAVDRSEISSKRFKVASSALLGGILVALLSGCMTESIDYDPTFPKKAPVAVETEVSSQVKSGEVPNIRCIYLDEDGNQVDPGEDVKETITLTPDDAFALNSKGDPIAVKAGPAKARCVSQTYSLVDNEPKDFKVVAGRPTRSQVDLFEFDENKEDGENKPAKKVLNAKAGVPVGYQCHYYDAYGNEVEGVNGRLTIDPMPSIDLGTEENIIIRQSGLYQVSCDATDLVQRANSPLQIDPGELKSVNLIVEPKQSIYVIDDVVKVTAVAYDEFGNEIKDQEFTVGSDFKGGNSSPDSGHNNNGSDGSDGDNKGPAIRKLGDSFYQLNNEGEYTFTVELGGPDNDVKTTISVEGEGPKINCIYPPHGGTVKAPEKGDGSIPIEVDVSDLSGLKSVTINGEEIKGSELENNRRFIRNFNPKFGINYFKVIAIDNGTDPTINHESVRFCTFRYAPQYANPDSHVLHTVTIQLDQDAIDDDDRSTFNSLADILHKVLVSQTVRDLLYNTIASHVDRMRGFWINGEPTVKLRLVEGGLRLVAYIPEIRADVRVRSKGWLVKWIYADPTIWIRGVKIDVNLALNLNQSNQLTARVERVNEVSVAEGYADNSRLKWFINRMVNIRHEVRSGLESFARYNLANILNSFLSDFNFSDAPANFFLPVVGSSDLGITMERNVSHVSFQPEMAQIALSTRFQPSRRNVIEPQGAGTKGEILPHTFDATQKGTTRVLIAEDLFNQALFAIWQGGFLHQNLGEKFEQLGTGRELLIRGLLPPMVELQDSGDGVISLGPLVVTIKNDSLLKLGETVEIGGRVKFTMGINSKREVEITSATLDDFYLLPRTQSLSENARSEMQNFLEGFIGTFISDLLRQSLPKFPIPGFTILPTGYASQFNFPPGDLTLLSPRLNLIQRYATLSGRFGHIPAKNP